MAVREERQLVVVVADDAAVTGDAEVLEEHVAGEDVRAGQVLDGVPVVEAARRGRWPDRQ